MPAGIWYCAPLASVIVTAAVTAPSDCLAALRVAVSRTLRGRPAMTVPPDPLAGAMVWNSRPGGGTDWSPRSSTTPGAWSAPTATNCAGSAIGTTETAIASRTPAARVTVPTSPADSGAARSTRTSAPAAKAAWSPADRVQLWCCASASVPVATAITSSSAAPPWRSGWRLNCQPAIEAVSLRPRAASLSPARAAAGSSRSMTTVPPASASTGARASTGSMLAVAPLPPGDAVTAE